MPTISTIIISAIIGAVFGSMLAYGVMNDEMDTRIESAVASFAVPVSEEDPGGDIDGGEGEVGAFVEANFTGDTVLDAEERAVTEVYNRVSPSVVHVTTVQYMRFFLQVVPQEGTGSGFIISEDGYILTNNHVIAGAQEITVRMSDGEEYDAALVGTDPTSDLAVLKIDTEIPSSQVTVFGNSDTLRVGQRAIAIGNPFGLDSTVTAGVISALDRPVVTDQTMYESMIQTDASINPGNSGGPLLDSAGNVIGINTVIFSQSGGSHGIGFAIPISRAAKLVDDLIEYGRVRRPELGFTGLNLYPNLADALQLPVSRGVLVGDVDSGSSVAEAGLRLSDRQVELRDHFRRYTFYVGGDIIVALDGEKVYDINVLRDQIRRMELGTEVILTVNRDGEQVDLTWLLSD